MKGRKQEAALGSSEDTLKQWTLIGDDSRVWLMVTAKVLSQWSGWRSDGAEVFPLYT